MKGKFYESVHRSVTKAITFRLLVLVSDAVIVYALTHRYDLTLGVVLFSTVIHTSLYLVHERLWNDVHWGKHKNGRMQLRQTH